MGAWGSGLYANDTTSDVRDTYRKCLMNGMDDQQAYEKTIAEYADCLADEDVAPLVWYALAETQWTLGRLLPEVKENALNWIEKRGGLGPWLKTPNKGKGWLKTLENLRTKLLSPMPKRKVIQKPKEADTNPWNLYDLYALELHNVHSQVRNLTGKYIVLQKIGEREYSFPPGIHMCLQVYDKVFDEIPTVEELRGIRLLPFDSRNMWNLQTCPLRMSVLIRAYPARSYPKKYLHYLGNEAPRQKECEYGRRPILWINLEDEFHHWRELWMKLEYVTNDDGIFHYSSTKEGLKEN